MFGIRLLNTVFVAKRLNKSSMKIIGIGVWDLHTIHISSQSTAAYSITTGADKNMSDLYVIRRETTGCLNTCQWMVKMGS